MAEKTKAREIAEKIEREGRFGPDAPDDYSQTVRQFGDNAGPFVYGMASLARKLGRVPKALMSREKRSEEEMSELTREVARDKKMAKGGKVNSASKRADGIAQRGKTRGKMY